MKKAINLLNIALTLTAFGAMAFGQSAEVKKTESAAPAPTVQTVDARQNGAWTVGIDPAKNAVKVVNTDAEPISVRVTNNTTPRRPFQMRVVVTPNGIGFSSASLALPAGKRLVIENISAVGRMPDGLKMEMNFFSYYDNNGNGVNDPEDLTFHRIALIEQGVFDGILTAAANHKVLIFADSVIGTNPTPLVMQARLNAATTAFAQAQLTISGYLEDLVVNP